MMTALPLPPTAVELFEGKPTTTSVTVAEVFGKEHRTVLRAIDGLELPPDYRQHNFVQTVVARSNPSGGAAIESRAYRMTKDGFTILAFGFTGAKAMAFKVAYIQAFNQMQEQLQAQRAPAQGRTLQISERAWAHMGQEWIACQNDLQALRGAVDHLATRLNHIAAPSNYPALPAPNTGAYTITVQPTPPSAPAVSYPLSHYSAARFAQALLDEARERHQANPEQACIFFTHRALARVLRRLYPEELVHLPSCQQKRLARALVDQLPAFGSHQDRYPHNSRHTTVRSYYGRYYHYERGPESAILVQ